MQNIDSKADDRLYVMYFQGDEINGDGKAVWLMEQGRVCKQAGYHDGRNNNLAMSAFK